MLDDPSLTTRLDGRPTKDPIRVILDAGEYLDADRRVFKLESGAPTWVAVREGGACSAADAVLQVASSDDGLDMHDLMKQLASREVTSVLIEGGGATHASAFEAGVVDKVMFFVAPKIVGGRDAVSAVEGCGIERMTDAIPLRDMKATPVGNDILIEAYLAKA